MKKELMKYLKKIMFNYTPDVKTRKTKTNNWL